MNTMIQGGYMGRMGVISTLLVMEKSRFFKTARQTSMKTEYGPADLYQTDEFLFVLRHGSDPRRHILPHRVNHRANIKALKEAGVTEIVGLHSTGSLKKKLSPGTIVIPHDFMTLTATPTIFEENIVHITPRLDEAVRQKLIRAAKSCALSFVQKAVYWQTTGPRLETKAEIAMMSRFADVVGMTMANEAVIAAELEIPYASVCSVDNYGHGLMDQPLSLEEILAGTRRNADTMIKLLESYLKISA